MQIFWWGSPQLRIESILLIRTYKTLRICSQLSSPFPSNPFIIHDLDSSITCRFTKAHSLSPVFPQPQTRWWISIPLQEITISEWRGREHGHLEFKAWLCPLIICVLLGAMEWITSPPHKFICWSPTPQWDGIWMWKIIRFRWGHEGGILMMGLVPLWKRRRRRRRGRRRRNTRALSAMGEHSKKAAVYKPGRELFPEPYHADTLILDFQPPKLWDNKSLLFKPPSLWYFVMAAWAD